MKKLAIAALLMLLISLPVISGVNVWGMKAEVWQKSDELDKLLYVQGIFDGMPFSKYTIHETKLSMDITIPQYVKAIDTLYADYKNSLIPVPFLLRVITLEIEGANKAMVEKVLEIYRKEFSKK